MRNHKHILLLYCPQLKLDIYSVSQYYMHYYDYRNKLEIDILRKYICNIIPNFKSLTKKL